MRLKLALLFACCMLVCNFSTAEEIINLGFIYSGEGEYITSGVIPAVELAVDLINNSTDILEDYQLKLSYVRDSGCDATLSQEVFLKEELTARSGPDTLALVGCGCSLATEPVAEITQYWNMVHMSYASSADSFSNRDRFPFFWRTYPQESNLAFSVLALMNQYNWTQLKIISQNEPIFTTSTNILNMELSANNITIDMNGTTLFDASSNVAASDDLFTPEIRIYFLNMYPNHARRVLCAAARALEKAPNAEFAYDKYVWITLGWYKDNWWSVERMTDKVVTNCTDEDVEQFLIQSVGIVQANEAENITGETDVQLTAQKFEDQYKNLLNTSGYDFEVSAFHAYDSIWALARAFNSSLGNTSLANYSMLDGNATITTIHSYLSEGFTGVSGSVEFNMNGTRVPQNPRILKYRDSSVTNYCGETGPASIERVRVAVVGSASANETDYVYFMCEDGNTTWPGGVPRDGTPRNVTVPVLQPLVIVYYILVSCGLIFAFVCLMFNIVFRNRKIVKLISPNLNYVIIFGAVLLYTSICFFVFPSTDKFAVTFACHIRLWLQTVGYFICFGTILAKIWRVHFIFRNPAVSKKRRSRIPKDWQLFIGVCVMVLVAVIVSVFVAIFGKYEAVLVRDQEFRLARDEDGVIIEYNNLVCDGPLDIVWIIILYAYLLLTQLAAFVLAFRTRKVTIKALNDAKYLSALIYTSTGIIVIMVVCAILLDKYQNADAAVFSGLLFIFTTLVLALMFIPKMVILYKDPQGQKIFQRSMSQSVPNTILATTNEDANDVYLELEKHCKELEGRLAKCGEPVPPFRNKSSIKIRSTSFSSLSQASPSRIKNTSISVPTSPIESVQLKDSGLVNGTSEYFTETDRSTSSTEPKTPTGVEGSTPPDIRDSNV